ncbi:transmembrane protein 255B isoform X2 [Pimephales promelas]|nr:transmembrane protein 255B-like isoform X2 [Pimephales promelas]XP_039519803.1 transmembrane protein 255B-like isoform X2 [Pimephales promelas]XP_039519872.1 transmembrane protein 255B isoform X2 [Pimephales promelas]XP_039519873.1 transmembrane protein 255B isoform X2 [Pimephales promelas]
MRRRKAQWLVSGMLSLSLLIVVMGSYISTRTESVSIAGYMSGIILAFGSFLGVLGLCLEENRKQLLIAAIVFLSFGIISSFLCLLVDGVFILLNIDMRPMRAGRCQFYTSGNSYIYENYYATVPCQGLTESCDMKVRSGTCYCCDLYDCANGGYLNNYYEFVGVQSCQEVLSLYVLLWILTALNLLAFVFGILTTAVLGSFKDMRSGVVGLDVSQWRGSSIFSFDGANCSSPTAPLLIDPNTHTGHQLYPRASLYVSPAVPAAATAGSSVFPGGSSDTSHVQPNPPPFAPLYNLLPYKTSSFSA